MIRTVSFLSVVALCAALNAESVSSLISKADAIVVGTESAPVQAGDFVTFYVSVERAFQGTVQVGSVLDVVWHPKAHAGLPDGSPSMRGIWFLQKNVNGSWECIPAGTTGNAEFFAQLSLPISQGVIPAQLAYDASATPLADQILLEMAGGTPRGDTRIILSLAQDVNSPSALQVFRYLSSQTGDLALVGLTGLIEAGDTGGILAVEALSGQLTSAVPGADMVAAAIQLRFRGVDPTAIAALGRMATSNESSPPMKVAAARALGAIHSPASIPWLGLLLDSAASEMRIYGAQGLSYFVNGVGIPTAQTMPGLDHLNNRQQSAYRTAETDQHIGYASGQADSFVEFWQNWWTLHPELHQ